MKKSITSDDDLFVGLNALADSAFPKTCANCGRSYQSAEDFLRQTQALDRDKSSLKQSCDDNDATIVEVYRNCVCGSTLMDFFNNRRDDSEQGLKRRQEFTELQDYLATQGVSEEVARNELLKVLRGESSELLSKYAPPKGRDSD